MKNAIVNTFCTWTSYGSVLQSYALKQFLKKIDVQSKIIIDNDRETFNSKVNISLNPKTILKQIYSVIHQNENSERYEKIMKFIDENLDIEYYHQYEDIKKNKFGVDIYIAGSDQIFHPKICNPLFFLDYAPKYSKKISYAASMGVTNIPKEKKKIFDKLISNFDYLSVRETECKKVIENYTTKEIHVNIDPTFLLNISEWREKENKCNINEKYILIYPIYWNVDYNQKIRELKKKTGYKIVKICHELNRVYADVSILNAGVEQFLWLIDHAEFVITSSFHGVALSTIFNKQFIALANPNAPSRINSLLDILEIKKLSFNNILSDNIDYDTVNKNIIIEQKRSFDYLNKVIKDEKQYKTV